MNEMPLTTKSSAIEDETLVKSRQRVADHGEVFTPNHSDIPEFTVRHGLHAFHEYRPNPPATARAQM